MKYIILVIMLISGCIPEYQEKNVMFVATTLSENECFELKASTEPASYSILFSSGDILIGDLTWTATGFFFTGEPLMSGRMMINVLRPYIYISSACKGGD